MSDPWGLGLGNCDFAFPAPRFRTGKKHNEFREIHKQEIGTDHCAAGILLLFFRQSITHAGLPFIAGFFTVFPGFFFTM